MLIFRCIYEGKLNLVGMGGGIVVGSGEGWLRYCRGFFDGVVDYAVISGYGRKTAWCVGEVAMVK